MRYRVRHVTAYHYGQVVDLASHLLHLLPRSLPGQQVIAAGIVAEPQPAHASEATDHFGNRVTRLFLEGAHERFTVTAAAEVAVEFAAPPPAEQTLAWEAVAAMAQAGGAAAWQAAEFALPSPLLPPSAAARDYAVPSFTPGRPVLAGLLDLLRRMKRDFAFRTGVTSISTPVDQVLALRAGVCQDFTHVMLAALRGMGLPARYVSGYIRTRPPPGQAARRGVDQSHAWVGCWLGPQHGWVDVDPTNELVVKDEHVVLGWGRDFADISPLRGVILGGGSHRLTVSVELEPLAAPLPA